MGIPCKVYFAQDQQQWLCSHCRTPLAQRSDFVSHGFTGKYGKACLFDRVYNIARQPKRETNMTSGTFIVQNIHCRYCAEYLGWAYVESFKSSETYKEGKFVLENIKALKSIPLNEFS